MPRTFARLRTRIWHDPEFLERTAGAQRLYMLLISQDTLNLCGVTAYTPKRLSRLASNTTPAAVAKDLRELDKHGFVIVDDDTEEIWVRTFLKWDGVLDTPNSVIAMSRDYATIRSQRILDEIGEWFRQTYPQGMRQYLAERFPNRFGDGKADGIAHGFLDGIGDGIAEPIADGIADGLSVPARSTRDVPAHARGLGLSLSPKPEPKPVTRPMAEPMADALPQGGSDGDGLLRNGQGRRRLEIDLATRLVDACHSEIGEEAIATEAACVVHWALTHTDSRLVEEAIGWAEQKSGGPSPVRLPRAVAAVLQQKAADHSITIPEFRPVRSHA